MLTLETQIAFAIARQIQITFSAHEDERTASPPRVVAADVYDNYLKGRFALNRNTRAGATESIGYFEEAIAADPSFAPAYSGIASAYTDLGLVFFGGPPREARAKAIAAAHKALALDRNLNILLARAGHQ